MRLLLQNRFLQLAVLLLLAALLGLVGGQRHLLPERLERQAFDWRIAGTAAQAPRAPIVVIQAGEESLQRLGEWPWPRSRHAQLLAKLGQARLVVLDVLFPERSDPVDDLALAQVVKRIGNVVSAMHIAPDKNKPSGIPIPPYTELGEAVVTLGVTNVKEDTDGLIRFHTPVRQVDDLGLPSLPLAAAQVFLGTTASIEQTGDGLALVLGERRLPLDERGNLWVDFSGPLFETVEYERVLSGLVPLDTFKDKIVLVGIAASGAEDFHVVPAGLGKRVLPGTQYNAMSLNAILNAPVPVRISPLHSGLLVLAMTLLGCLAGMPRRPMVTIVGLALLTSGFVALNLALFRNQLLWVDFVFPLLALFVGNVIAAFIRYLSLHRDWTLKSYSLASLYNLEGALHRHESLGGFLKAIWPKLQANTGVRLLIPLARLKDTTPDVRYALETDRANNNGTPGALVFPVREGNISWKMILPVPSEDEDGGFDYVVLGWRGRLAEDIINTLAVTVLSATWFFQKLSRNREKRKMLTDTIHAIFKALDFRDPITGGHSDRVATLTMEILADMDVDEETSEDIHLGALIHDIGKIGIPDAVLGKPGKLTGDEFGMILKHPAIGDEIMHSVTLPEHSRRTLAEHHERYDGSGYPRGLSRDEQSLGARIVAVADVFDALRSDRPYRKGLPVGRVCDYIYGGAGKIFDPQVVEILLRLKAPADWKPGSPPPPDARRLNDDE